LIHEGLQPGPSSFVTTRSLSTTFFAGFLLVNILFFIIAISLFKRGQVVRTRFKFWRLHLVFCVLGAYASSNSMVNVTSWWSQVSRILSRQNAFRHAPLYPRLILGPLIEANFWASLLISYNDYFVFFKDPWPQDS